MAAWYEDVWDFAKENALELAKMGGAGAKAQRLGQKLDRVLVLPAAARRLRRTRPPGVGSMRLGLAHGVSRALAPHPEAAGSGQP